MQRFQHHVNVQASANGDVSQPRLNADLVGDLLALDDEPSAAGNTSAAVDLLADLLGDGAPVAAAGTAVAGGSQAVDLMDLLGGHADSQPSISSQPSGGAAQQVSSCRKPGPMSRHRAHKHSAMSVSQ